MELPLILAGPILRRVDPGSVAVWMAFSEPADARAAGVGGPGRTTTRRTRCSPAATTRPIRRRRHHARAPRRSGSASSSTSGWSRRGCHRRPARSSSPTSSYSYDVVITAEGEVLGPGRARPARHASRSTASRRRRSATTTGCCRASRCRHPSSTDLRIAYGSCRRPGYDDGDALAWMDELIVEPASPTPGADRTSCSSAATRSTPTTSTR